MWNIGDKGQCFMRGIKFTVTEIIDLGEGIMLLGYIDDRGERRWIRSEICTKLL